MGCFVLQRSIVFKWLAAVAMELGQNDLPVYLTVMLQPLVQELTSQTPNQGKSTDLNLQQQQSHFDFPMIEVGSEYTNIYYNWYT